MSDHDPELTNVLEFVELGQKLGVELENIEFRMGAHGIGAYKIKADEKFRIFIPEHLIIPTDEIDFHAEFPTLKRPVSTETDDYFSRYLSIIWTEKRKSSLVEKLSFLNSKKDRIKSLGLVNIMAFEDTTIFANSMISAMYSVNYKNKDGVRKNHHMPIMDFLNHDRTGLAYKNNGSGLQIAGTSETSEIFARYNASDPISKYSMYLFSDKTDFGYSVPCVLQLGQGRTLVIQRDFGAKTQHKDAWQPKVEVRENSIVISYLTIANLAQPLKPLLDFQELAAQHDLPRPMLIWDRIKTLNFKRLWLVHQDIQSLESAEEEAGKREILRSLKKCFQDQIESITY